MTNLELTQKILLSNFIEDATDELKLLSPRCDLSNSARSWGGAFTDLPATITFHDVKEMIKEYNETF